ncbi:MAG: twin-arginine translocase subunit TatC [Candidatus Saccharimonadaceae bacterium]
MTTMSAKRHLRELQWRLMFVAAFFILGACLAYNYQSQLIPLLLGPLRGEKLVYLNPGGGFSFIFMVSIYAGIALAFPVLLQQLYAFLRPVLPKSAQRKSLIIIVSSLLLLFSGILFGYLVAVPNALNFLYSFADQYVVASLTAESYLNFIIAYTIGIGIVFQLPLLLLLIHTIKPFTPGGLLKSEKWVVLVAFIIAAVITPTPDPVNQCIIAGPVIVIYQIGVFTVLINIAKQRRVLRVQKRKAAAAQALLAKNKQKLQQATPILSAIPLALEDDPIPDHSPLLQTALATTQHRVMSDIVAIPSIPTAQAQPAQHSAPVYKTMDGVIIQRQAPKLQVPQREQPQPLKAPVRPQQAQPNSPHKGFYVDGIIAPRRATSF